MFNLMPSKLFVVVYYIYCKMPVPRLEYIFCFSGLIDIVRFGFVRFFGYSLCTSAFAIFLLFKVH